MYHQKVIHSLVSCFIDPNPTIFRCELRVHLSLFYDSFSNYRKSLNSASSRNCITALSNRLFFIKERSFTAVSTRLRAFIYLMVQFTLHPVAFVRNGITTGWNHSQPIDRTRLWNNNGWTFSLGCTIKINEYIGCDCWKLPYKLH